MSTAKKGAGILYRISLYALSAVLAVSTAAVPCSGAVASAGAAVSGAVSDDPNLTFISPRNINYTTGEAFIGSLERAAGYEARLNFPKSVSVLIPRDGMFMSMNVGTNDWIDAGEPIAVFSVVANELELDEAALAYELAESAYRRNVDACESNLENARSRLEQLELTSGEPKNGVPQDGISQDDEDIDAEDIDADAPDEEDIDADVSDTGDAPDAEDIDTDAPDADNDAIDAGDAEDAMATDFDSGVSDAGAGAPTALRRAELAVLAAEAELSFTIYSGGRDLNRMRARLDEMIAYSEDFTIYAPISGIVHDIVYFAVGRSVPSGQFMCRISDPDAFQLVISAPNLSQLRFGAHISIETSRRDSPVFPGRVIGNTSLLGRNESDNRAVVAFDDPIDFIEQGGGSIHRLTGLRYRVVVDQADIQNVLLAPRRAINTESSYRYVHILEDGLSKKRYVIVGLSNMEYTQILGGIKAGDVLILN